MCILCENIYLIPIQIINFINNYNKDKDIYFENNETKEVSIMFAKIVMTQIIF